MDNVSKVDEGLYVVREDDDQKSIASRTVGDVRLYATILKANDDWKAGDQIKIPNKKGRVAILGEGESLDRLIKRMFPNQPVHIFMELLNQWNNEGRVEGGDIVFIPER